MKPYLIVAMLVGAGTLMSFAWIGHLKYKSWTFWMALAASWALVLPEYVLNVYAVRWGQDIFSGAQMAAIHLCAGVICVAMVSYFFLGEETSAIQICGFGLLGVSIGLIMLG